MSGAVDAPAQMLPLRFQLGARTLASVRRELVRMPLSLDMVLEGRLPSLPSLPEAADGYSVTSLPEDRGDALIWAAGGMAAHVRQRYPRHYADLTIGHDAYLATLSSGMRSGLKRKRRRLAEASAGTLDIRRFRTPDEMAAFHAVARAISIKTYQERLLGGGLPDDAAFRRAMLLLAAADAVRGWLLYVAGEPAAFLYCPIEDGIVRYDHVGHDPAFSGLSPGGVLLLEAMRDLHADGNLRRFDFTEGDGQHKRSFATHSVPCLDLLLLRPTLANRATLAALGGFDAAAALGKRVTHRFGLAGLAKRVRR